MTGINISPLITKALDMIETRDYGPQSTWFDNRGVHHFGMCLNLIVESYLSRPI